MWEFQIQGQVLLIALIFLSVLNLTVGGVALAYFFNWTVKATIRFAVIDILNELH